MVEPSSASAGERSLAIDQLSIEYFKARFGGENLARNIAVASSVLMHAGLFALASYEGVSTIPSGGGGPARLQIRVVNRTTEESPKNAVLSASNVISSGSTLSKPTPTAGKTVDHFDASLSDAASHIPGSSTQIGMILDLEKGLQIDPSYWLEAREISSPVNLLLTINPAGFIDKWSLLEKEKNLSIQESEIINKIILHIAIPKTGETYSMVWAFNLGNNSGKTIANIYQPTE